MKVWLVAWKTHDVCLCGNDAWFQIQESTKKRQIQQAHVQKIQQANVQKYFWTGTMRECLVPWKTHDVVRNEFGEKFKFSENRASVWRGTPLHFCEEHNVAIMDGADLVVCSLLDFCTSLLFMVDISKLLKFSGSHQQIRFRLYFDYTDYTW